MLSVLNDSEYSLKEEEQQPIVQINDQKSVGKTSQ